MKKRLQTTVKSNPVLPASDYEAAQHEQAKARNLLKKVAQLVGVADWQAIDQSTLPAATYLATQRNQATIQRELNKIAQLTGAVDWREMNWATLNAANVAAIFVQVKGVPTTRNKTLSVLKGVAQSAWRLNLIDSEQLEKIRAINDAV